MKFSSLARPPIQAEETERAEHSICPAHDGLVRETGDIEGKVMYCPIGKSFWRFSARSATGMYASLPYPQRRFV